MSDGFLSRWSRRKLEVKEGRPVEAEPQPEPAPAAASVPAAAEAGQRPALAESAQPEPAQPEPPPLTLADVQSLTAESDFTRFVAPDVAPEVKNAAMKKLFADPRYNVMDGLDTYIDDYSRPDPLPEDMLRKLVAGKFLGLFAEEELPKDSAEGESAAGSRDVADNPAPQSVAQSAEATPAVPEPPPYADPDLRLQQDDAARPPGPGRGAE